MADEERLENWPPYACPTDAAADQVADEVLSEDEKAVYAALPRDGASRRQFLQLMSAAGAGLLGLQAFLEHQAVAQTAPAAAGAAASATAADLNAVATSLTINGQVHQLNLDSRVTLLDALRERLGMTGTKKGCDHGQCGACTVIVDGERVLSCLTLAAQADGKKVTTIEGLAQDDDLHPMQAAFIKHDGFQCGYCTPGQICSAVALLEEAERGDASHVTADVSKKVTDLTDDEVRERMSGNLCRCGAYPNIVAAIQEVRTGQPRAQMWEFAPPVQVATHKTERSEA